MCTAPSHALVGLIIYVIRFENSNRIDQLTATRVFIKVHLPFAYLFLMPQNSEEALDLDFHEISDSCICTQQGGQCVGEGIRLVRSRGVGKLDNEIEDLIR